MIILFDFDGTLAQTLVLTQKLYNEVAVERGYRVIEDSEIQELRNKTALEVFKLLNVPVVAFPTLAYKVQSQMQKQIAQVEAVSGIPEVLVELQKQGFSIGVLTSNSSSNVDGFLAAQNIQVVEFVISEKSIFGKAKILKKILTSKKITPDELVYVGDETRDIEATKKAGVRSIAVSWGFNSRKALESANPDFLLDSPEELLAVCQSLRTSH